MSAADREWLRGETADSPFDPQRLRQTLWKQYEDGSAVLDCRTCTFGKVLCVHTGDDPVPWDDWGRIFALFSEGRPFRVGFFAAETLRRLPAVGGAVGPGCVNGGYTMSCKTDTIVIYRTEEATRVLLHELFHATCSERDGLPLPQREGENEAWAEWALVAFRAAGSEAAASRLFAEQVSWVGAQNAIVRKKYGVRSPNDFLWRYTIGREAAYRRLGFQDAFPRSGGGRSCRLSSPTLD